MNDRYNGWTNYETWCWKLWVDNEEPSQDYWLERARSIAGESVDNTFQTANRVSVHTLADELKSDCEDNAENWMQDQSGPFADILNAGLSQINWYEIAESLLSDSEDMQANG